METLIKCCGSEPVLHMTAHYGYYVQCSKCELSVSYYPSHTTARNTWNKAMARIEKLRDVAQAASDLLSRHDHHHESGNYIVEAGYFRLTQEALAALPEGEIGEVQITGDKRDDLT